MTDLRLATYRSGLPTGGRPPMNPGQQQELSTEYYGSQSGQIDWAATENEERVLIDCSAMNPPQGTLWRVSLAVDANVRCSIRWGTAATFVLQDMLSSVFAVPGRFTIHGRKVGGAPGVALANVLPAQGSASGARVLSGVAGGGLAALPRGTVRFTAAVAATIVEVFGAGTPTVALAAGQTVEVTSGGSVTAGWGFSEVYL